MFIIILQSILIVILAIILYFKYAFQYWKKKGIPSTEPEIPYGDIKENILLRLSIRENLSIIIYNKYKNCGKPYVGAYLMASPVLIALTPDFLKKLMVEDFKHFTSRPFYYHEENDPLSAHLFFLGEEKWRFMRQKLTPAFTSGKIKSMFNTLVACSDDIRTVLDMHVKNKKAIDIKDMMARYTTDVIGSVAFGIECNSLKEPDSVFRKKGKRVFDRTSTDLIVQLLSVISPTIMTLLKLRVMSKESTDFFLNLVKDTVDYREQNNIFRNDFLQLLIQLKKQDILDNEEDGDKRKLTIEQMAAQCFLFFVAGFETSSSTLSCFIYEVSRHQDIQDKVRKEIHEVLNKHGGELTYDAIKEMSYLRQVIDETFRWHPVSQFITRKCTMDYKLPGSNAILERGTNVFIPVYDIHNDPRYFENPEIFDPERFSTENKHKVETFTYMPFGHGPKNCIGMRFGMIEMVVALVSALKNHRFTVNPRTIHPLKQHPRSFINEVLGGIWIDVERIK